MQNMTYLAQLYLTAINFKRPIIMHLSKNVLKMMVSDGLMTAIPGGQDGYIRFLEPFLPLIKKEKKLYKKNI